MEYNLSLLPEESEFSLESEQEGEEKTDPFFSPIPTWSTRYNCLRAYCCFVLNFLSVLRFCQTMGRFGFIAFIPYWLYNIFFGVGSVLVEIQMGRFIIGNISRVWTICPFSRSIFWNFVAISVFTIIYNNVCSAYLLQYCFASFVSPLPWSLCNEEWTPTGLACFEFGRADEEAIECTEKYSKKFCNSLTWESSARLFWRYRVKRLGGTKAGWAIFCMGISIGVSFVIIYKGIRSVEKFFSFLVYITIGLWVTLACVTFLTPNALEGLVRLWVFRWHYLYEKDLWFSTFGDIVYILGLGRLTLTFISSHGRFDDNFLLDVLIASVGGLFICVLITTPVLSIVATLRHSEGVSDTEPLFKDIDDVFIYMSEALTLYPSPKGLWSGLTYLNFFLMSATAQALATLATCEAIEGVLDQPNLFFWISLIFALITFALGLLFIFFPAMLLLNINGTTVVVLLLSTIVWQNSYGVWKFNKDYYFMMGRPLPLFLKSTWLMLLLLPTFMVLLKLSLTWNVVPFNGITYVYLGIPVLICTITTSFQMFSFYKEKRNIFEITKLNVNWGPQNPILRKSRMVFDCNTAPKEMLYRQELCNRPYIKPPDFSNQNIVQLL